ncbi:hypothetical protein DM867_05605 [Halosegnis rubeus]|uniref:Uncharacterized protein n=1 Tax=Halosegnis rubeus TaxID=2212850 RepID=A0A5N5U7K2_9EURY|nr:hypothetical protein [Halosegnis rubeus]KAB7514595.1 hypothetical protein DM867_05605 [Halosegnis rubeus]
MVDKQRRKLLGLTGTALATGLAGCGGNSDGSVESGNSGTEDGNEDTGGESSQDQEAVIEFLDREGIQTVPIVTEETSENTASIELEVEDPDGLENILFQYNDSHRDQPFTIYDKARSEFENGTSISTSEEFPQKVIAPNTGEFYIEVKDTNGNTTTRTEPIEGLNSSFRADRKRKQEGKIGNYNTDRNWDNIVTDTERLRETQQRVLQEQAYTELVNQVMNGEDFEAGGRGFPNYDLSGENSDPGFFDQDAVKNEDDFETLVRWYLPAIMDHDRQNYGSAPSSRNDRFAATLETLINEHHPEAEAVSTSVKSLPDHGIFGVQEQNNEEFYLVDTTAASPQFEQAVAQINDGFITSENGNRSELWEPFHDFSPGKPSFGTYEGKSRKSLAGLYHFVSKGADVEIQGKEPEGRVFMTDEWMNEAYQVLRNGGSIQPITNPIEELFYNHQTNGRDDDIGIYGTLDDTRIAVTDNEEVYETVMYDPNQAPGIEEIENMLGAS